ncbi:MAG TPA: hypothetical protein VM884_07125 [Flavisolibacter sp.]|nr:hypothetical protein [Flavisolibacter sp.]
MKRLTAILFLSILVFNFYGYRLVLSYMQADNKVAIERQVDKKEYNDNELISFKTTLNLPYYTSSAEYERAYGSVSIDGKEYEYVKRRVYNDTLELLCLPNNVETKIKTTGNDIAKASADGRAAAPLKKSASALKMPLPDFCQSLKITNASFTEISKGHHFILNTIFLPADHSSQPERPPKTMHTIS